MKKLSVLTAAAAIATTAIAVSALKSEAAVLSATYNSGNPVSTDFTITFDDANGNNILDAGEVTLPIETPDFSGITFFGEFYDQVSGIADIPGVTNGFSLGPISLNWIFTDSNGEFETQLSSRDNFSYEIIPADDVATPEPATVFGLLLAGGAGLLSKRRFQ